MRSGRLRKPANTPPYEKPYGIPADTLLETITRVESCVGEMGRANLEATLSTPESSLGTVRRVMEDWEKSGAIELFKSERHMTNFYRATMLSLFVQYAELLQMTLSSMKTRLVDPDLAAPQLLTMAQQLGVQLTLVKDQANMVLEPDLLPDSVDELDRRLGAARVAVHANTKPAAME